MSGTDLVYGATRAALSDTVLLGYRPTYRPTHLLCAVRRPIPLSLPRLSRSPLSAYARAMRCPVLRSHMVLTAYVPTRMLCDVRYCDS
eukprot:3535283-Rhodomonas_salina.1